LNNVDSNLVNLDFAYQPVSVVSDLAAVTAYSWQPPRPGFTITYELKVANAGTVPLADTVVFTFDSKFSFGSANPAPLYQNGNSVAWLTATVNPLVAANPFTVELTLDAATPIGTEVSHTMTLAAANDDEPANAVLDTGRRRHSIHHSLSEYRYRYGVQHRGARHARPEPRLDVV
jgi:hypothetical protein